MSSKETPHKKGSKGLEMALREIIRHQVVEDQQQLLELLKKGGHSLTQATLSRRLKDWGFSKIEGKYTEIVKAGPHYTLPIVSEIVPAPPNLVVVRTQGGHANAVAARIDEYIKMTPVSQKVLIGTIAGDDTVFVACVPRPDLEYAERLLKALLQTQEG